MIADDSESDVRLRELSVVDDGDNVVIGEPRSGRFVAVPPVGGVVVRALLGGASLAQAAAEADRFAGQPVDVPAWPPRTQRVRRLLIIASHPSLTQAARAIGVPATSLPAQLARLEGDSGGPLLHRSAHPSPAPGPSESNSAARPATTSTSAQIPRHS